MRTKLLFKVPLYIKLLTSLWLYITILNIESAFKNGFVFFGPSVDTKASYDGLLIKYKYAISNKIHHETPLSVMTVKWKQMGSHSVGSTFVFCAIKDNPGCNFVVLIPSLIVKAQKAIWRCSMRKFNILSVHSRRRVSQV